MARNMLSFTRPKAAANACRGLSRIAVLIAVAVATIPSLAGSVRAGIVYDNLNPTSTTVLDRVNESGRGLAQGFIAGDTASVTSVTFNLLLINATTGDLNAALYSVSGSAPYAIDSQIGTTKVFNTSLLTMGSVSTTTLDVSSLSWAVTSGDKFAIALWAGSSWYNPAGTGDGVGWMEGSNDASNLTHFNNWAVGSAGWEDWGNSNPGFAVGLNVAVPEPTGMTSVLWLLSGGLGLLARRIVTRPRRN